MASRSALINVMIGAARKAARRLIRDFGEVENLQVSLKGPADFVSNADRKSEQTIHHELLKARPHFSFLMEESGAVEGSDTSNRWIIDPLDGTTNFLHGIPHFSISIGLERDNDFFAGLVYAPIVDEMFWAEKGQGAWLNGRRLRVSGRRHLEEAVITTGVPTRYIPEHPEFLMQMAAVMDATAGVRRFGSAALDMAYVAAGRFEGFWEPGLSLWDYAAGVVLVREAGGFVTAVDGHTSPVDSGDIAAANYHLHRPFTTLLQEAAQTKPVTPPGRSAPP